MSQFDYYLAIILLGVGNLGLALIAYRQRDKQMQVGILCEIRDALVDGDAERGGDSADVIRAAGRP